MDHRPRPGPAGPRRPVAWGLPLAVAAASGLLLATEDLPVSHHGTVDPAHAVVVDGTVVRPTYPGKVRYEHPVTGRTVEVGVDLWSTDLPGVGRPVRLRVDRRNPLSVAVDGDRPGWWVNLPLYLAAAGLAVVPGATRAFGRRRTRRLVASPSPGFRMLGALSRTWPGRARLHLYPADAPAESPPLCSIRVLDTAQAPFGVAFPVEVKGSPRPMGRVVARVGPRIAWPVGRALRTASHPRPAAVVEARGLAPAAAPTATAGPLLDGLRPLAPPLAVALAALVLAAGTAVVTADNQARAQAVLREGRPVLGEVTGRESGDTIVVLRVEDGDGELTTRAPATYADQLPLGMVYPLRLDPSDPARAVLEMQPYDRATPVGWAAAGAVAAAWWAAWRWRWQRLGRRSAAGGPFAGATARTVEGGGMRSTVHLLDPDGRPVAEVRTTRPLDGPVTLAGGATPGGPVALWSPAGRPVAAWSPLRAPEVGDDDLLVGSAPAHDRPGSPRHLPLRLPASVEARAWMGASGVALGSTPLLVALVAGLHPLLAAPLLAPAAWLAWRGARVGVTAEHGGLVARNLLGTRHVAWADVEMIDLADVPWWGQPVLWVPRVRRAGRRRVRLEALAVPAYTERARHLRALRSLVAWADRSGVPVDQELRRAALMP
ncbi:MAG: hypothetical protein AB7L84_10420 [Acidimicrobiia bacterium]